MVDLETWPDERIVFYLCGVAKVMDRRNEAMKGSRQDREQNGGAGDALSFAQATGLKVEGL